MSCFRSYNSGAFGAKAALWDDCRIARGVKHSSPARQVRARSLADEACFLAELTGLAELADLAMLADEHPRRSARMARWRIRLLLANSPIFSLYRKDRCQIFSRFRMVG